MPKIDLELRFGRDRQVKMPVRVMEAVASPPDDVQADLPPVPQAGSDEVHIDPVALFDREALDEFFRRECRNVRSGGRVKAYVYEGDDEVLLDLLEVTPDTPRSPIVVKVPNG